MKIDIRKIIGEFSDDTDELTFGQNDWSDRENRKIIINFWSKKLKEINKLNEKQM